MSTHNPRGRSSSGVDDDCSEGFVPSPGRDGRGDAGPGACRRTPQPLGFQPGVPAGYRKAVPRLHDINLSGWFYLLGFAPFVGGILPAVLMLLSPRPQGARFDR